LVRLEIAKALTETSLGTTKKQKNYRTRCYGRSGGGIYDGKLTLI
jgi:hypothetical protein